MGTPKTVKLLGIGPHPIYIYQHSDGYEAAGKVRTALDKGRSRWNDPTYLARIVFCQLVGPKYWEDETGWGLSTEYMDSTKPVIVVDCEKQIVYHEWPNGYPQAGSERTFEEIVTQT